MDFTITVNDFELELARLWVVFEYVRVVLMADGRWKLEVATFGFHRPLHLATLERGDDVAAAFGADWADRCVFGSV